MTTPFNSAIEVGVRSVVILTEVFPRALDLQHLVFFDYFSLHSQDVGGPESLHAPVPLRHAELTVRRELIERGLLLMMSRGLVLQIATLHEGFQYSASESASAFLSMLSSPYIAKLRDRVAWVIAHYGDTSLEELHQIERRFFHQWSTHFQPIEYTGRDRL